jgi:hypothetical protein
MLHISRHVPTELTRMNDLARFGALLVSCLCCAYWTRSFVSLGRPGFQRLLISLPVIAFFHVAPLLFDWRLEVVSRTCCVFLLTWLASFKVVSAAPARHTLQWH